MFLGQWSECSITCVKVGFGIRSRSRICLGGSVGRGGCSGLDVMTQICVSAFCLAKCGYGFNLLPFNGIKQITLITIIYNKVLINLIWFYTN